MHDSEGEEVTDFSGADFTAAGFAAMDDPTLFARRAEMRADLKRLPPRSPGHVRLTVSYDVSTAEVNERARIAWARQIQEDSQ